MDDSAKLTCSQLSLKEPDPMYNLLEHPPYSPDIAPSDFWLFGFINEERKGTCASSEKELISKTSKILEKIDSTVLGTVYQEWIRRLHRVIESEGWYLLD